MINGNGGNMEEELKILEKEINNLSECMKAIESQKDDFEEDEDYIYFKELKKAIERNIRTL